MSRPDEAAALVTARMTGKRVRITGLTTETDEAWAQPNGTVSVEHRFRPVRVRRDGDWVPVDATLVARPDGSVAPKAAVVDVAFSGGGTAPMVTLRRGKSTLTLGSPTGDLPTPSLEGDTAVYAEVLPGVDLRLTADVDGFSQVLVVKTPEAARNRKLATLAFRLAGKGATTRADKAGNLSVVDAAGQLMFIGSTPVMWDEDFAATHRDTGREPDPHRYGRFATMPVATTADSLSITPDAGLLTSADTTFPVYIDPGYTLPRRNWTYTNSAAPTTSYWNSSSQARIGTPNAGATKYRSYFVMNASNVPWQGKHLLSARLDLNLNHSASCTPTEFGAHSLSAAPTSTTTWNNQPTMSTQLDSATTNLGAAGCAAAGVVSLNVTEHARQAQLAGAADVNIGLRAASETDSASYKEFTNSPSMWVVYTGYATVASRATSPSTACVAGSGRPFVNTTTPQLHAVISDDENQAVRAEFEWFTLGGTRIGGAAPAPAASGSTISATVWAGQLTDGGSYAWRARGYDTIVWGSWTGLCEFTVDAVAPNTAPTVTSAAYPNGVWAGGAGTPGTFTFDPVGVTDVAAFVYGLNTDTPTTVVNTSTLGGTATVTITPTSDGPHTLTVRSRDRAGNLSPVSQYLFNVGNGAVTSPRQGDLSAGKVTLEAAGQSTATGVTYQWRRGDADSWATIPTGDVSLTAGGGTVTWPVPTTGSGPFPKLNWNVDATVNAAEAGADPLDGPLQVRALFTGMTNPQTSAVTFSLDRARASAPSMSVGPGSVNLLTGNMTVSAADVSVAASGSDLTLSRTFNSRQAGVVDPMFGPGWVSSTGVQQAGAPYTGLTVTGSLVQVNVPAGDSVGFTHTATTTTGATFTAEPGAEDLTLTYTTSSDSYTLTNRDDTTVVFNRPTGAAAGTYVPTSVSIAGGGQTSVSWETVTVNGATVTRPTRILAPPPAGVTCTPSSPIQKGCRSLQFTYAATTTATGTDQASWGDYAGRLSQVSMLAFSPSHGIVINLTLIRYAYDSTGRLRQGWNPVLDYSGGHHGTTYAYNSDGILSQVTPPGLEPWQLGYTTIPGDAGKGRLASVTRSALSAGTATTTIVYRVPATGTGAPHDLSVAQTARWGQTEQPVDATAVFPPTQVPNGDQATGSLPSSYERATITYLDANGRTVNAVTPGGHTTAAWYDRWGNTVRTLDAGNLRRALDAATNDTPAQEAAAAEKLSTVSVYSADGQQLRETFGPEHDVVLPAGSTVRGRTHTVTSYDQGAPAGGPYHLPTTQTTSVAYTTGGQTVDADERTTSTEYDWTLRQPTKVTVDPNGLALTTRTTYDGATGLVTSTTTPGGGATTNAPYTRVTVYYRAGTGSGYAECDNRPEWANLPCRVQPGGQPATGPELPVTVTTYDLFNQPTSVVEKTSVGVLRTTTITYDAAGRIFETSVSAPGLGQDVPTTRTVYNRVTGLVTFTRSIVNGAITAEIIRTHDNLGRQVTYTDADNVTTTTSYDLLGRTATTNNGKSVRTYTYDQGAERRGLPTSVHDSLTGTMTAEYDANGTVTGQSWPNGITITSSYDATGAQTGLRYERPNCGQTNCTLYSATTGANAHSQQRWITSTLSNHIYGYDNAGRMTRATDTASAACTLRVYQFDNATNRTALTTYDPATNGACQATTPAGTTTYTYDTADRITGGYTYDALGRTTTLPANHTANPTGGNVTVGYHTTDRVKNIAQGNRATSYTLDVIGERIRSWTDNATGMTVTRTHHYDGDSDNPSWTNEGDGTWSTTIAGISGLAATRASSDTDWKITNLHGDLIATITNNSAGLTATHTQDEYGNPKNASDIGTRRYGWLGAAQRAADTADGSILMGARLYNPVTSRFASVDAIYGGNANNYDYCSGDGVNCSDVSGNFSCTKMRSSMTVFWPFRSFSLDMTCFFSHAEAFAFIRHANTVSIVSGVVSAVTKYLPHPAFKAISVSSAVVTAVAQFLSKSAFRYYSYCAERRWGRGFWAKLEFAGWQSGTSGGWRPTKLLDTGCR